MDETARQGNLHIVQWLHGNRSEGCTQKAFASTMENDHYKVLAFLLENYEFICDQRMLDSATSHRHFDVLELLMQSDSQSADKASEGSGKL